MATTIQNLRSLTAGNQPGDLAPGELAFNLADGFMYLGSGGSNYVDTLGQVIGPSNAPGGGWQQAIFNAAPINGSVQLAGIYDAQDNLVTSVTAAGTAVGFTAGAALPASAAGNEGYYVLVQIGGTMTPPAPTGDAAPGDWLVSSGSGWSLVQESSVVIPASNVTIVPTGDFTGPSMQDVLNQIQLLYTSIADGVVSQLNCNGDALVYGNTTLGDADTDTLTVNATSSFAAPVNVAGTLTCASNLAVATTGYFAGNLRTIANLEVDGSATLGNAATDTVAIAGPVTCANNLTVSGVSNLNGATAINGTLTTTNTVSLTGAVTASSFVTTTGDVTVNLGGAYALNVSAGTATFANTSNLVINGNLDLNQGTNAKVITYSRPLQAASGQVIDENLNNFLVVPGTIIAYGGNGYPSGYLPCDGAAVSRNNYADLFFAIGTSWGSGNGSTTFNVPDLRGMFLRGTGANATFTNSSSGRATGPAVGTFIKDGFQSHNHVLKLNTLGYAGTQFGGQREALAPSQGQMTSSGRPNNGTLNVNQGGDPGSAAIQTTGGDETVPVNVGISYCIKY